MKTTFRRSSGFTLIELLIVISIIAVLAGLAFVALNPLARFQDSRNARRWTDVNSLISAVKLYQVDHGGIYPDAIQDLTADLYYQMGAGDDCADSASCSGVVLQTACVDLADLVDGAYLPGIAIDPNAAGASADETRYYLSRDSYGRIIVGACSEEEGTGASAPVIEIIR
jgi:prepilin-type N-terminal cleavage/methylation domain-containing protein